MTINRDKGERFALWLRAFLPRALLSRLGVVHSQLEKFAFVEGGNIKADIYEKYNFSGDLVDIFSKGNGLAVHKWHHYIPLYDRYFQNFRAKGSVRFLEIGVSQGGSLQMWREFFGEDAIIYGIDINPDCRVFDGIAAQVRIGSQNDAKFLESVIREMGGVDVILDDGSHRMSDLLDSFRLLFPRLNNGGIYMIEDLHTAYWRNFGGGYHSRTNFFRFVSALVDDMHHWYHSSGLKHPSVSRLCSGIHIHDSIAVFEKQTTYPPTHSKMS
jgi:hypothetical protein